MFPSMAKPSGNIPISEIHVDAWARFERAVDVVAKSPPQHRTKGKPKASQKKRGQPRKDVLK
jgi:hypothetical protein